MKCSKCGKELVEKKSVYEQDGKKFTRTEYTCPEYRSSEDKTGDMWEFTFNTHDAFVKTKPIK